MESSFQGLSLLLLLLMIGNISLIGVQVSIIKIISIKYPEQISWRDILKELELQIDLLN